MCASCLAKDADGVEAALKHWEDRLALIRKVVATYHGVVDSTNTLLDRMFAEWRERFTPDEQQCRVFRALLAADAEQIGAEEVHEAVAKCILKFDTSQGKDAMAYYGGIIRNKREAKNRRRWAVHRKEAAPGGGGLRIGYQQGTTIGFQFSLTDRGSQYQATTGDL